MTLGPIATVARLVCGIIRSTILLSGSITGVDEVFGALLGFEVIEECTNAAPGGLGGARIGFVQQGLELGKDLLDRVEIRRVARQEEQLGADAADQLANRIALMAAKVIHDDDVAGAEGGDQELFDVSAETGAVDRPVNDAGSGDPVTAQCRQKGQCPPAAVRQLGDQAGAARSDLLMSKPQRMCANK